MFVLFVFALTQNYLIIKTAMRKTTTNPNNHAILPTCFLIYETIIANKKNSYSSFCFRLKIFVLSINTVSAAQKTTKIPKVIKVALGLCGA